MSSGDQGDAEVQLLLRGCVWLVLFAGAVGISLAGLLIGTWILG